MDRKMIGTLSLGSQEIQESTFRIFNLIFIEKKSWKMFYNIHIYAYIITK